eukprot:s788_g4.t1
MAAGTLGAKNEKSLSAERLEYVDEDLPQIPPTLSLVQTDPPELLDDAVRMSNHCSLLNRAMAQELLLGSSEHISATSDVYTHEVVAVNFNHFTMFPPISYDLSFALKVPSLIRPKGTHQDDVRHAMAVERARRVEPHRIRIWLQTLVWVCEPPSGAAGDGVAGWGQAGILLRTASVFPCSLEVSDDGEVSAKTSGHRRFSSLFGGYPEAVLVDFQVVYDLEDPPDWLYAAYRLFVGDAAYKPRDFRQELEDLAPRPEQVFSASVPQEAARPLVPPSISQQDCSRCATSFQNPGYCMKQKQHRHVLENRHVRRAERSGRFWVMASAIRLPAADTLDSSDEEEVEDVGSVQPPAEQAEQAGPEASKATLPPIVRAPVPAIMPKKVPSLSFAGLRPYSMPYALKASHTSCALLLLQEMMSPPVEVHAGAVLSANEKSSSGEDSSLADEDGLCRSCNRPQLEQLPAFAAEARGSNADFSLSPPRPFASPWIMASPRSIAAANAEAAFAADFLAAGGLDWPVPPTPGPTSTSAPLLPLAVEEDALSGEGSEEIAPALSSSATVGGARPGTDLVPKHERPVRPTWSAGKRTSVCTDLAGGWWASGVVTCRLRRHLGAERRALRPNLGALVGLTVPTEAHEHALAEGEADWPPNSTSNHIIVSWLPVISVAGVRKLWRCRSPSRAV